MFVFYDWDLILLNLQIKPQKLYINFFTTKNNQFIFTWKKNQLASVGITEKNSENQEKKNTFGRRQTIFLVPDQRFWGFKPLREKTNSKQT